MRTWVNLRVMFLIRGRGGGRSRRRTMKRCLFQFFPLHFMRVSRHEARQTTKTSCYLRCAMLSAVTWKRVLPRGSVPSARKSSLKLSPSLAGLQGELAQVARGKPAGYVVWFKTGKGDTEKVTALSASETVAKSQANLSAWIVGRCTCNRCLARLAQPGERSPDEYARFRRSKLVLPCDGGDAELIRFPSSCGI